jgi:broad specificity phosphatase PhoE
MGVAIVYETHSITEDNERGIAIGRLPGRLSAEGRRLARQLGERRRGERFVFVSDLGRAVELAFGHGGHDGGRVLLIGHSATRGALQFLLEGTPLEQLVDAPFAWQEGWEFRA